MLLTLFVKIQDTFGLRMLNVIKREGRSGKDQSSPQEEVKVKASTEVVLGTPKVFLELFDGLMVKRSEGGLSQSSCS